MSSFSKFICVLSIGLFAFGASVRAEASPPSFGIFGLFGIFSPPKSQLQLVDAETVIAPFAFYQFCAKNADQCNTENSGQRIEMTPDTWAILHTVNARVNYGIRADASKGAFDWSLNTVRGNCNDYAVQKRKALMDAGFPMAALSLSVVKTGTGEGHLVLTVRTSAGDFVLDNLRNIILPWTSTGYHWIIVQSNASPLRWVRVKSAPLVAKAALLAFSK